MWQPPRSADGYLVWALSGAGTVPTLRIKDPAYQEKMANIDAALALRIPAKLNSHSGQREHPDP